MKEWKNACHGNRKHKKAGMAILILDKVGLKIKNTTRDKAGNFLMIKRTVH